MPFSRASCPQQRVSSLKRDAELHVAAQMILAPIIRKIIAIVAISAVTIAGLGAWYLLRAARQPLVGLA